MRVLTGLTVAVLTLLPQPFVQAQEHPGCFMINSSGAFMNLEQICPPPNSVVAANNTQADSVSGSRTQNVPTYCEGLPDHLQAQCYINYDRGGTRFGTTIRPQSTHESSLVAGRCNNPWDRDAAGRRCGGRAASQRPGGR